MLYKFKYFFFKLRIFFELINDSDLSIFMIRLKNPEDDQGVAIPIREGGGVMKTPFS